MALLRRRGRVGDNGLSAVHAWIDPAFRGRFATLWEFLTLTVWDDGTARLPGTLLIFSDSGAVKACISDKDSACVGFLTAATFDSLLESVEAALAADSVDWRLTKGGGAPSTGRKKT